MSSNAFDNELVRALVGSLIGAIGSFIVTSLLAYAAKRDWLPAILRHHVPSAGAEYAMKEGDMERSSEPIGDLASSSATGEHPRGKHATLLNVIVLVFFMICVALGIVLGITIGRLQAEGGSSNNNTPIVLTPPPPPPMPPLPPPSPLPPRPPPPFPPPPPSYTFYANNAVSCTCADDSSRGGRCPAQYVIPGTKNCIIPNNNFPLARQLCDQLSACLGYGQALNAPAWLAWTQYGVQLYICDGFCDLSPNVEWVTYLKNT